MGKKTPGCQNSGEKFCTWVKISVFNNSLFLYRLPLRFLILHKDNLKGNKKNIFLHFTNWVSDK